MSRILCALVIPCLVACASTPKNGALLASQVTVGIHRMEAETEAMITALGNIERAVLSEAWEELYRSSEAKYRAQEGLPPNAPLTEEQRIDVATVAAKVREDVLVAIADKEQSLKASARENARRVTELNQTVEAYLMSLEELEAAKAKAKGLVAQITGIDVASLVNESKRALDKLR